VAFLDVGINLFKPGKKKTTDDSIVVAYHTMCQTLGQNHLVQWCQSPLNINRVTWRCHMCHPCPTTMVPKLGVKVNQLLNMRNLPKMKMQVAWVA
jgi:hypothetical protein